jgi:tRNA(Arg) A34 adenosine deaminase TadA
MQKLSHEQIIRHLRLAQEVAIRARDAGRHPFGAILVGADGESVLAEQGNIDIVDHAESALARTAHSQFSAEVLWECALFTTVEPCVMCAGTIYWANIGTLVFGMTEARLLELTGNHAGNPTLNIPSRYVFEHGHKAISVIGPVLEVEEEIARVHRQYWRVNK